MAAIKEVLFIDDDPEQRVLVKKLLEGAGFRVAEAANVTEAINLGKARVPHLVITDLNMPEESGFDFLEKRRVTKGLMKIPVIVMSARSDAPSVSKAVGLGACDYVLKPVNPQILLQKVKKAMRSTQFLSCTFPADQRPYTKILVNSHIIMANEAGFCVDAPVKLAREVPVSIRSKLLEEFGVTDQHLRTSATGGRFYINGRYLNDIIVAGVFEKVASRIRKAIKDWDS